MALSDEDKAQIKAEIAEARRILREDAQIMHNKRMDERWTRVHGPDPTGGGDTGNPDQPPAPDPKPEEPAKQKKGFWWGDALYKEQSSGN